MVKVRQYSKKHLHTESDVKLQTFFEQNFVPFPMYLLISGDKLLLLLNFLVGIMSFLGAILHDRFLPDLAAIFQLGASVFLNQQPT
jgi:hypothetical protein